MKKIFCLALLMNSGLILNAQHLNKYCNSVYSFCVDIPGNYIRKGESKTGSGQNFAAKDGSTLIVYGTPNDYNESAKQRFEKEQAALTTDSAVANTTQLPIIEKAELQENSFRIVYQNQNLSTFIYRRLENNTWKNIELQYPSTKAKKFEEMTARLITSLR